MNASRLPGTVLFVSPGPNLMTPASGHGTRLRHLSKELQSLGWDVLTLVPERNSDDEPPWVRRQYSYQQWSFPFLTDLNPSFVRSMARIIKNESVDIVHVSHGVCLTHLLSIIFNSGTAVNYASQNVEAEHARDFVNPDLPIYKRLLGPRLIPPIERLTVRCADSVTTVSRSDRMKIVDRYRIDPKRVKAVQTGTSIIDKSKLESQDSVRERYGLTADTVIVFHGSYAHPPNAEAVDIIVEKILPRVRDRGFDIEFLLVGKGMPQVEEQRITTAGFVEDLFATLNAADFAVVPILHGGGTRTKVYDYLSLGMPIISTAKGIKGIDLEDGVHGYVTETVNADFIDGVVRLAQDLESRNAFAENVGELAKEMTWKQSGNQLSRFYSKIIESQ